MKISESVMNESINIMKLANNGNKAKYQKKWLNNKWQ